MKPGPNASPDLAPLLAFGAHPDDIEFGCGGVIAQETRSGRAAHLVVCSRGESGTNGTPAERTAEAEQAARLLGATIEFADLGGDAHFECRVEHALALAVIIRRIRPAIILAPSTVENQHPDHSRLGRMVRDAARLARYGGVAELRELAPHAIRQLFFFAVTPDAEPRDISPLLIDVSAPEVVAAWHAAMAAHVSQLRTRDYDQVQLLRARANGARCGVGHAIVLFPGDPPLFSSLAPFMRGARHF